MSTSCTAAATHKSLHCGSNAQVTESVATLGTCVKCLSHLHQLATFWLNNRYSFQCTAVLSDSFVMSIATSVTRDAGFIRSGLTPPCPLGFYTTFVPSACVSHFTATQHVAGADSLVGGGSLVKVVALRAAGSSSSSSSSMQHMSVGGAACQYLLSQPAMTCYCSPAVLDTLQHACHIHIACWRAQAVFKASDNAAAGRAEVVC
jgi:hypothetical protein